MDIFLHNQLFRHKTVVWRWRMAMLFSALLLTLPGWADDYYRETLNESVSGMGKVKIKADGDKGSFEDDKCAQDIVKNHFHSIAFFDNAKGQMCYEFFIKQHPSHDKNNSAIEGDITVKCSDDGGGLHDLGVIVQKDDGNVSNGKTSYGELVKVETSVYRFYPSPQLMLRDGIQQMEWGFHYNDNRKNKSDKGHYVYIFKNKSEHGLKFNFTPMPEPSISVASNGYLHFHATGVPGGCEYEYYHWSARRSDEGAWYNWYGLWMADSIGWKQTSDTNTIDATVTDNRLSPKYSYYVSSTGTIRYDDYNFYFTTPTAGGWYKTIPGYLYATDLQATQYDQWKKTVTISWKAVRTDKNIMDGGTLDRNADGQWHIYREYDNGGNIISTELSPLSGSKTDSELHITDTPPDYDISYTYRVIFIPTVMEKTDISWFEDDLKPSITVNTNRQLTLSLHQDQESDEAGIKLVWTYNIQENGSTFRVERQNAGSNQWTTLEGSSKPVITSQTTDSYLDTSPSSTCDFYNYRVVASTLGTEFVSNVAENCNLPDGTRLLSIDATKGTEPSVTVVTWTVDQRGSDDTYFDIQRRCITNGKTADWVKVGETHGTASEYSYTDERVEAGSFYEYRVIAYGLLCDDQVVKSSELTTIGYCQARGTITGHISYGTGTSVEGVRLNLIKSGTDEDQAQFFSSYIDGNDALTWVPDADRYANTFIHDKPFSVQLWMAPAEGKESMSVFSLDGMVEVKLTKKDEHSYYLCYNTQHSFNNSTGLVVEANRFSHLSAVWDTSKWTFYLHNGDGLTTATSSGFDLFTIKTFRVGGTKDDGSSSFIGLVDEVRLWSKALSEGEVSTSYDRLIGGTESGLVLYWPLDEGINGHAFDVSKQNGINNQNHATVGANVKPSTITPSKLGLYGLTDSDGNYIIRGIPFDAGGTNYKLLPEFGIHEFNPTSRNLYISPSSLTANNVDFTDESSFPMRGYVYYSGTNIPAKGIYLYIDGNLVTTGGQVAQTNEEGYYEISVPIGEHFVEAKQTGHKMVNEGRWPTKNTFNFQEAVYQNFSDSTLVNFCGRVAGGEIQNDKPVGFGEASGSKNNIGVATITLGLSNPNLSFNCEEGTTNDLKVTRPFYAQNPDTIRSTSWAGANTSARYIYIKTDSITGEFSALLPPLTYNVTNITVHNNPDAEINDYPEIDLSNPLVINVDTLLNLSRDGDDNLQFDVPMYKYNQKMVSTYYSDPILELSDLNDDLNIGAYGIRQYKDYEDEYGKVENIDVYTEGSDGAPNYLYGYPVYMMKDPYTYQLYGYEKYVNYDSGVEVIDIVPMKSQVLTVSNEMSADQRIVTEDVPEEGLREGQVYNLQDNQLALDSLGKFTYTWTAGLPNTVDPYTRHLGISYKRNNRTYTWEGFDAYVFGTMPLGNDFVTKGPDNVLMVLRDPPGSASSTSWTRGHTHTSITKKANGAAGNFSGMFEFIEGVDLKTATGVGFAIVSTQKVQNIQHAGFDLSGSYMNNKTTNYTLTATETVSTSSNKEYVGANGDVFIGASTNLLIGTCKKVGFFRESADPVFEVKDSIAMSLSDSITTIFNYSALEIEKKQIPEWKKLRNSILLTVDSEADAKDFKNGNPYPVFVTWEKDLDQVYANESYITVKGTDKNWEYVDSVAYYENQIALWQQVLANNEKDKVEAMSTNSPYYSEMKNISFDSGAPYSYTEKNDTTKTKMNEFNYSVMLKGDAKFGLYNSSGASFGINLTLSGSIGYKGAYATGHTDDDFAQFNYNMVQSSPKNDMTVDIYQSPAGWSDVFCVRGGRTSCPYEGETTTKYYEPGKHVLSYATTQIEKPQIRISDGRQNPSTIATISDVPAGSSAFFTLTLYNESPTEQDLIYGLSMVEGYNPNGLRFTIDGVALSSGRTFLVPAGEVVTKTLEVKQSDLSILDYENVRLSFTSTCQNDLTSVNGIIADFCSLNVHFKPSSSPVTLTGDLFVVNTVTDGNLNLKLTDFDRNFQGLKRMGVEYKSDGATSWTQVQNYVFAKADSTNVNDIVVPSEGDVRLVIDMSDKNSYPDGNYIFRAFTETPYGDGNIRVYSEEVTVVKDMSRPTALGTPLPTDGVLNFGDDLMVEFNEDIIPAYVNASNIQVTGKLNKQPTTHEVSLHLTGDEPTAQTANDLYLRGNSTVAMWLKYTQGGTIFRHCSGDNALTFGIDADGHLTAKTTNIDVISKLTLPKDEWIYLAYAYDAITTRLDMIVQHDTSTDSISTILGGGRTLEQVVYADDKKLYLGGDGFEGDLHDLRIYSITRDVLDVASEKYNSQNIYTAGLMAHWPLDEGQGFKGRDLRNDSHPMILTAEAWRVNNDNYAAVVDSTKQQHIDLSLGGAATDNNESYVLEFWFRSDGEVAGKTLFQAGTDYNNNLRLYGKEDNSLMLGYGAYIVPVSPSGFDASSGWHHFALNVMRGSTATVSIDGRRTAVVAEADVPPIEGGRLVMGAGFNIPIVDAYDFTGFMSGSFDEVRIWKGVVKPEVIKDNMYNCLDTLTASAKGLCLYYPMETKTMVNGVSTVIASADDMAPGQVFAGTMQGHYDLADFSRNTPPLKNAPEMQTVITSNTVSDRKIAIELQPNSLKEIEGTTLEVTVTKIFDKNGNPSDPITWQVYVHQNTLEWQKDSVNVIKRYGDTATFDVVIENTGNTTEQFVISQLPTWLTTEQSEGELAPSTTQIIRFEVSPLAAVGQYDVNLSLTGNNGIDEPLRVVLTVKGEAPDWTVDTDKYEDLMNMVAQVIIDGIVSENPESRLAAFLGDECVGIASPEKARGSYYVPMTIYGSNAQHKNQVVTFKYWDASTNNIYTGLNEDPMVLFKKDSVKGSYNYPVILTNTDMMEQTVSTKAGWNWISLNVHPEDNSVNAVMQAEGLQQEDMLKSKTQICYYDGTRWIDDELTEVKVGPMYKLKVQQPVNFIIKGHYNGPAEEPITLNYGWNWIGYTPIATLPINEALGGSGALEGDYIKSKTAFAIYGPYGWDGNLKALEPGKGYMLFSQRDETHTFTYPEVSQNANSMVFANMSSSADYYFTPVDESLYPDNMSIVAKLICDELPVDTAEIGAFIDGECRATARANNSLYYLMVQGEDSGQTISLRTIYNGDVLTIDESLTFLGDSNIGLPWSPYIIDISALTGITTFDGDQEDDAQYYLPNGIRVDKSMLHRGQVYIIRHKTGKAQKFTK